MASTGVVARFWATHERYPGVPRAIGTSLQARSKSLIAQDGIFGACTAIEAAVICTCSGRKPEKKRVYLNQHVPGPDECGMGMLKAALDASTHTSQCLKIDSGAFSRYRAVVRMMKEAEFCAASTDWEYIDSNGFPGIAGESWRGTVDVWTTGLTKSKHVQFNHPETVPLKGKNSPACLTFAPKTQDHSNVDALNCSSS